MPTWIDRLRKPNTPSVSAKHLATGQRAEQQAAEFLQGQGLRLIETNFRTPSGEIDLIMRDGEYLVFVEVRFRKQSGYGSASETVDFRKQQKLQKAAAGYLQKHKLTEQVPCRFDVIAIDKSKTSGSSTYDANTHNTNIEWLKNAF